MLILRRKKGEKIVMSGGIIIDVVNVVNNVTVLGFKAPASVLIYRAEKVIEEGISLPDSIDAVDYETAVMALRQVVEWYDRDGSVGGAVDPMEFARKALGKLVAP